MTARAQDPGDTDLLAAEYVLGTLPAAERAEVAARRHHETSLDAAILAWERRFVPLDDVGAPVSPAPDMFARITRRIDAQALLPPSTTPAAPSAEIIQLTQRVRRWKAMAIGASALAASLVLAIGLRETVLAPQPQNFVAVFQKDDALPSFLLSLDLATRQLTIRPVAAEPQAGKIYQLWIASEQIGPAPRSLGLLEDAKAPTRKSLAGFDAGLLERATFGVSVEPPGGSPTGRPSGNPLHAKLFPAKP